MTRRGKKVCIFSDSICKPINMIDFNNDCRYNSSIKRSFPGATTTQLKYYIKPTLLEDMPDIVVIHIGTNNLTKKPNQSDAEIVEEIIEMVNDCHTQGVNEIYISSITYRHSHLSRINSINRLLSEKSFQHDYQFIDNSNIKSHHLRNDKLHLASDGARILGKNFLDYINRTYVYNNYNVNVD